MGKSREIMHTILLGINHKTAKVETREKVHFNDLENALTELISYPHINGTVILSTCNRVEIYATTKDVEKGLNEIVDFISEYHQIETSDLEDQLYKCTCSEAVKHLFHVISSLDSMVLGEMQIQGQVREAYKIAKAANATDSILNKLFQTAIQVGKRIRSETAIGEGAVSVGSVAVDVIKEIFSEHPQFNALLLGAGKMSELTAKSLARHPNCNITVSNRSEENAKELAQKFDGRTIPFENRNEEIMKSDVVVVSTGAQKYIINTDIKDQLKNKSKNSSTYFIDLSVPRNVDPALAEIDGVHVYSVDSLKQLMQSNEEKRKSEVDSVIEIISDLTKDYYDWYTMQTVVPVMKDIKHNFHDLGLRMLNSHLAELGDLNDSQIKSLEGLMDSYASRIIKVIMKNLQQVTDQSDLATIAKSLKHTFNMNLEEKEGKCPYHDSHGN